MTPLIPAARIAELVMLARTNGSAYHELGNQPDPHITLHWSAANARVIVLLVSAAGAIANEVITTRDAERTLAALVERYREYLSAPAARAVEA